MKKIYIILIFILGIPLFVSAQTPVQNLMKYWYYRNRLQYFVVAGDNPGESQVAVIRNYYTGSRSTEMEFGGNPCLESYGPYLGVLATEYYCLNSNGQSTDKTLCELYYAIEAYKNLMDECENRAPWNKSTSKYDGFFMRDYMPKNFIVNNNQYTANGILLNKHINTDPPDANNLYGNSNGGDPNSSYEANGCDQSDPSTGKGDEMSQDEAIGLMQGLALVRFCVNSGSLSFHDKYGVLKSYDFVGTAQQIVDRVVTYISFYGLWFIRNPNGTIIGNAQGGWALPYSYGFEKAYNRIVYPSYLISNPLWNYVFQAMQLGISNLSTRHLSTQLAAMGNSWHINIPIGVTIFGVFVGINIQIPSTGMGIYLNSNKDNWDPFYELLFDELQSKNTWYLNLQKGTNQLNDAPCSGPWCRDQPSGNYSSEWATPYKWIFSKNEQNNGLQGSSAMFSGIYNGLDYMLLYNLWCIHNGVPGYYINYKDLKLSGCLPVTYPISGGVFGDFTNKARYLGFSTITSTQNINDFVCPAMSTYDPGWCSYKAEDYIHLNQGFHASLNSYFHAYIGKISCTNYGSTGYYQKTTNYLNSDYSYLDSLPSVVYDSILRDSTPMLPFQYTSDVIVTDTLPKCAPDTLNFNGIGLDSAATAGMFGYYWDFGNGQISSQKNFQVIYKNPGTYHCKLVLTIIPPLTNKIITDTLKISDSTIVVSDTIYSLTDSIKGNTTLDTLYFNLVVPSCSSGSKNNNNNNIPQKNDNLQWNNIPPLKIIPNPNNGNMKVEYTILDNENGVFEIFDMYSKEVASYPLNGGKNTLNITKGNLAKGVYFYRATAGNKVIATGKIVIIK